MNSSLLDRLRGTGSPSDIVLQSGGIRLSRHELAEQVQVLAEQLEAMGLRSVALYADNGIEWVLVDLACQHAELTVVPLPLFFSCEQLLHAMSSSGIDAVISDRPLPATFSLGKPDAIFDLTPANSLRICRVSPKQDAMLPLGTQKITFTSGTTGTPKGVCLSGEHQLALADALASTIGIEQPRHLCVLPLSTLLENVAGIYAPLMAAGTVIAPSLDVVGVAGSSGLFIGRLLDCIDRHEPSSLILVPEILNALTMAAGAGWRPPESLRFVAVGGGKVSPDLLVRARNLGLPAYEGYGLSECSSVICLNRPGDDQVGAVGRPLHHVTVTTMDGEIVVTGNAFLGYANQPDSWGADSVYTGDLGRIDADGFVHVDGRKKHQFITSFGRNLSPEWVESELLSGPLLQQAVVIGDDRPFCVALLTPRDPSTGDEEVESWIDRVNLRLPDYARIAAWHRLPNALNVRDGLLTENGRPKRANVELTYQVAIDDLYEPRKKVSAS